MLCLKGSEARIVILSEAKDLPSERSFVSARDASLSAPHDRHGGDVQRSLSGPGFIARYLAGSCAEFAPHAHVAYTVTAVLSGLVSARVGDLEARLGPGDAALANPGQVHGARATDFRMLSISLEPTLVEDLVAAMGLYHAGAEVGFHEPAVVDPTISDVATRLAGELLLERPGQTPMIDALVRQLAVYLGRSHLKVHRSANVELSRAGPVDRRLRRALEFMHDNYPRDLAVSEIARAAYLSEYYFAHLFKEITGVTPHAYLANLRLERARELLLETDLPIGQIASRVGYRSQSHFARAFKAASGASPRAYRESRIALPSK